MSDLVIQASRQTFLALCGASRGLARRAGGSSWLDPQHVGGLMAPDGTATLVYTFSGTRLLVDTVWAIPLADGGTAHGRVLVWGARLRELETAELIPSSTGTDEIADLIGAVAS